MDWEPHFSDPDDFQHAQVPQLVKNHFFVIVVWCLIHVGLDAAHVPGLGRLKKKTQPVIKIQISSSPEVGTLEF